MNPLNSFYNNTHERESVKDFLIEALKEIAVEKAFKGESVEGIAEAKQMVDAAFDKLEVLYGKIPTSLPTNTR